MERLALDRWASPWLRNQHVARYRWACRFAANGAVLDAACGSGYGSRLLRDAGASHVTSADLSLDAFEEARRQGGGLHLTRADAARLPFAAGTYALYTCFETIEHVDGDRELLLEAKRVLRAGGTLLCSTPNRELLSPGNTLHDTPLNPYHVREYSIAEFRELLESVFDSVALFGQTWFTASHSALLRRVGAFGNGYAVRTHQLRNVLGLPWEREARHVPQRLDTPGVPEVVVAICRAAS